MVIKKIQELRAISHTSYFHNLTFNKSTFGILKEFLNFLSANGSLMAGALVKEFLNLEEPPTVLFNFAVASLRVAAFALRCSANSFFRATALAWAALFFSANAFTLAFAASPAAAVRFLFSSNAFLRLSVSIV